MTMSTMSNSSNGTTTRTDNVIIQQVDGNINANCPTKLVKLLVPSSKTSSSSSSSIKMLSRGDGLASALRTPTKIQLTKPLLTSSSKNNETSILSTSTSLLDIPAELNEKQLQSVGPSQSSNTLPPTPPPPVIDHMHRNVRTALFRTSNHQKEDKQKTNEMHSMFFKGMNKKIVLVENILSIDLFDLYIYKNDINKIKLIFLSSLISFIYESKYSRKISSNAYVPILIS